MTLKKSQVSQVSMWVLFLWVSFYRLYIEYWSTKGEVVALIKPQFEAGREQIGKNGIIRDAKVHQNVLESVTKMAVDEGFSVLGLDFSPIQGGHGNIEFLAYLRKEEHASNQVSFWNRKSSRKST